ncbi:MAG TPA: matrixin family metalloprotease [Thermoanaerobaculia bacterium]|jgi:hypothetical protein|nr:matrixin family metalloprotease [Thermoanaerobaculia bacterium]
MKSKFRLLPLLALPFLFRQPATATTYQMMSDSALADQAPVVVEARISSVSSAPLIGQPATDYLVEVNRVLKGDLPGSTVMVRVPGGLDPQGLGLKIWGAPRFAEGENAILFLGPAKDGTYRILHLMLGAFHERTVGGRTVALRDLSEAHEIGAKSTAGEGIDPVRDFSRFSDWISDRAARVPNAGDYVLKNVKAELSSLPEKFAFFAAEDGNPIRWYRFDSGQSVEWKVNTAGQPGLGLDATIAAFQVALNTWTADPGTNINYVYGGTTQAATGLTRSDRANTILFDDPFRNNPDQAVEGTFDCNSGGVIAMGGPFYYYPETKVYKGKRYHEAAEADIVTNDGTQCLFQNNPSAAEEVFTHELGHTLGLDHSKDRNAVMYPFVHNDGRGSHLEADDRAAVAQVYGNGSGSGNGNGGGSGSLAAPLRLAGRATSSTTAALTWRDKAKGEESYVVEAKVNVRKAKFQVVATVPAGTAAAEVTGLTPGTSYTFRVRAVAGSQSSPYSKAVVISTPR